MSYPTELKIVQSKIKAFQFSKYSLNEITEESEAKELNQKILSILKSEKNMNMKKLRKLIWLSGGVFRTFGNTTYFNLFGKNLPEDIKQELYNQFVGDYFEAFAEFFLKTFNNESRFGVRNYEPNTDKGDFGVDGSGECYDDTNGIHPCVIQVKYRINPEQTIDYSCLANTFTQGSLQFGIKSDVKYNIILFSSCKGANYIAKNMFNDMLYEINDKLIDPEINLIQFWEAFSKCF